MEGKSRIYFWLKLGSILFLLGSMGWILYCVLHFDGQRVSQDKGRIAQRLDREMTEGILQQLQNGGIEKPAEEWKAAYLGMVYSAGEVLQEEGISYYCFWQDGGAKDYASGYLQVDVYDDISLKRAVSNGELTPSSTLSVLLNDYFSEELQKRIAEAVYHERDYREEPISISPMSFHLTGWIWQGVIYPESLQLIREGNHPQEGTLYLGIDTERSREKYYWKEYTVIDSFMPDIFPDQKKWEMAKKQGQELPAKDQKDIYQVRYFPNYEVTGTSVAWGDDDSGKIRYFYDNLVEREEENAAREWYEREVVEKYNEEEQIRQESGAGESVVLYDSTTILLETRQESTAKEMVVYDPTTILLGGESGHQVNMIRCYYYPTGKELWKGYRFLFIQLVVITAILLIVILVLLQWAQNRQRALEKNRKNMTRAIAHELKTPLAVMKNYLEIAGEEEDREKCQEYYQILEEEIQHMDTLVLDMLEMSRLEAGVRKIEQEEVELVSLTQSFLQRFQNILKKNNLQVDLQVLSESSEEVLVIGDVKGFQMVIGNYLTNAIKNTKEGGRIEIVIRCQSGKVCYQVSNYPGPQLSKREQKMVWYSFYKGDRARVRHFGSSGLGLAIVRMLMHHMRGRSGCRTVDGGMMFWFTCPGCFKREDKKQ